MCLLSRVRVRALFLLILAFFPRGLGWYILDLSRPPTSALMHYDLLPLLADRSSFSLISFSAYFFSWTKYQHNRSQLSSAWLISVAQRSSETSSGDVPYRAMPCCAVLRALLHLNHMNMHSRLSLAQLKLSSTTQRRAVRCRAPRCCVMLRCAFFRTYSTRYHARSQVPGTGVYVCTRPFVFFI